MASSFHLFGLLPLELRQRIWELSLTHRHVPVGYFSNTRGFSYLPSLPSVMLPPAVLHACAESRSHLLRYYAKIVIEGLPFRYVWANYDLDTICMADSTIDEYLDILPPIKHLSVDVTDSELSIRYLMDPIQSMPSLEDVEFKLTDGWFDWFSVMGRWYKTDAPVSFRATIVHPNPLFPIIDQENHDKVESDYRRRRMAD